MHRTYVSHPADRFVRFVLGAILAAVCIMSFASASQPQLVLKDPSASVDLWPAVSLLRDPDGKLSIDEVLASADKFVAPASPHATLGLRQKVVWLRAMVHVPPAAAGVMQAPMAEQWILDFDYSLLNRIDVYAYANADGGVSQHVVLGNLQPNAKRLIRGRSHAAPLVLAPGASYTLIARVETAGAMILPLTLSKFAPFYDRAINEHMLQGLLISLGLCLLLYSMLQWASLREPLYLKYSILIVGSLLFSAHFFGIGELYLWTENVWL
ncbi:MAG: 7TM-DISM domain-containing protein, partial [Usitatibacteraceae bacterium]